MGSGVFISGGFKKALQYLISVRLLNQGDRSQATTQLVQIVLRSQKDLEESHEGSKGNTSSPLLVCASAFSSLCDQCVQNSEQGRCLTQHTEVNGAHRSVCKK